MLSMINRGRLPEAVQEEFEHLFAKLRGFLSQAFDADGQLIVADPNLAIVPVGGVLSYGGTAAPTGWVLCNGASLNRVAYKSLFDVIGTTYGAGDGTTTFNAPNLQGRFTLGKAATGTGSTLGAMGGAIDHTHGSGSHTHSIPDHAHTVSASTTTNGAHSHTVDAHSHGIGSDGLHGHLFSGTTGADGGGSFNVTADGANPASASPHSHDYSGNTDNNGSHDHGGNTGNASPGTTNDGDHAHTLSGSTDSGGSGTTGASSGTTDAANPPYTVVNYIIFAGV